jgi:uncharacterized protein YdhG (YjbR/CyaY superfamily)
MASKKFTDIDDYISSFPKATQVMLQKMREVIKKSSAGSKEIISYNMPAFSLNGTLVYFAAYQNHIGFYPTSSGIRNFQEELNSYKWSKGAIQFPLNKPLPVALIRKIVKFRVEEVLKKAENKKAKSNDDFLQLIASPAQRALKNQGIKTLKQLSGYTESAILALHGMGPGSMKKLRIEMKKKGFSFKSTK